MNERREAGQTTRRPLCLGEAAHKKSKTREKKGGQRDMFLLDQSSVLQQPGGKSNRRRRRWRDKMSKLEAVP